MFSESQIRQNLRALKTCISQYGIQPEAASLGAPQILADAGIAKDFICAGRPFYGADAAKMSADQIAAFPDSPRFRPPLTVAVREDAFLYRAFGSIDDKTSSDLMLAPTIGGTAGKFGRRYAPKVIVFGLALAYHVPLLIEQFDISTLILCETDPIALAAALAVQNWDAIVARAKNRGIRVKLVFQPIGELCGLSVLGEAREGSHAGLVGARFLVHHKTPAMAACIKTFENSLGLLAVPAGYAADELRQIAQTQANLQRKPIVSEPLAASGSKRVAVIVGSGPSLDRSFEIVRRMKDASYLFACGSALEPLLKAGLVPDLYVELETGPTALPYIEDLAQRFDISGIPLLASSGVHPSILDHFRHGALFPRETNCSTMLLGSGIQEVMFAFSRVGNAGAALALHLGFRDIVLVGMDTAYSRSGPDHAQGTVYDREAMTAKFRQHALAGTEALGDATREILGDARAAATIAVPGIAGDTLFVDQSFAYSMSAFINMAEKRTDATFHQIGYGAALRGMHNETPERFNPPAMSKDEAMSQILARCPLAKDAVRTFSANLDALKSEIRALAGDLRSIYAREIRRPLDFVRNDDAAYWRAMKQGRTGPRGAAAGLLNGTMIALAKSTMERALTLDDDQMKIGFLEAGSRAIGETLDMICDEVQAL